MVIFLFFYLYLLFGIYLLFIVGILISLQKRNDLIKSADKPEGLQKGRSKANSTEENSKGKKLKAL